MATTGDETGTEMQADTPEWWEGQEERPMTYAEEDYWRPSEFRPGKTQAHVARRLNEHGIPCVLWGPAVHHIYGSNSETDVQNLWVIPDRWFSAAVKCLESYYPYLEPCTRGPGCHFRLASFTPRMGAHLHSTRDCTYLTGLYRQSAVLPSCRPIPTYLARLHDPGPHTIRVPDDYVLASDPSLRKIKGPPGPDDLRENPCALPADAHPVLLPAPHRLVESYLRLHAEHDTDETYENLASLLDADEKSEKGLDLGRAAPSVLAAWERFKEDHDPCAEPASTEIRPLPPFLRSIIITIIIIIPGPLPPRVNEWGIETWRDCYCDRPDCYSQMSLDELDEACERWGRLGIGSGVGGEHGQEGG